MMSVTNNIVSSIMSSIMSPELTVNFTIARMRPEFNKVLDVGTSTKYLLYVYLDTGILHLVRLRLQYVCPIVPCFASE
jgi:hypothetical protein